ncbi:hypothetical protein AB0I28_31965 [Phytomonospora sp. NPDC050363]|uniref:hypothetical protein n=1 Tax=Phytomonospora sp. NPDC050363 TaxID=3155642 RepID=UPI003410B572
MNPRDVAPQRAADKVTVAAEKIDPSLLPPRPSKGDMAGSYQRIVLNTRTGRLRYLEPDWRIVVGSSDDPRWRERYPGERVPSIDHESVTKGVPDELSWVIDSWDVEPDDPAAYYPRPYLTPAEAQDFVDGLVPLAQRLVDELFAVPGSSRDRDWSAESMAAAADIGGACSREQRPPQVAYPEFINAATLFEAIPALVDPNWINASDDQLNRCAEDLLRDGLKSRGTQWRPDRLDQVRALFPDAATEDGDYKYTRLQVYGLRAWMHAYRAKAAAGLTVINADDWYSTHPTPVTADTTDAQLLDLADREKAAAAAGEGALLVGVEHVLREQRKVLRQRGWDELGEIAKATAAAEAEYKRLRTGRTAQVARIIGWGDHYSSNDADLGRQARISRQAVGQLRAQLDTDD